MKNIKREIISCPPYDRDGMARRLEAMAARGWMLDGMTKLSLRYRRDEPRELHFAVTYDADFTRDIHMPEYYRGEFFEMCEHDGWQLAAQCGGIIVLYNERRDAPPLETEPEVEIENMHRALRRRMLRPDWCLLAICLAAAVYCMARIVSDPVAALAELLTVPLALVSTAASVRCAAELLSYYLWRRRALKAAVRGEKEETRSPRRTLLVSLLAVCLGCVFILVIIPFVEVREAALKFVLYLAAMVISLRAMNFVEKRLARRCKSETVSVAAGFIVGVVLLFALRGAVGQLGETWWETLQNRSYLMLDLADLTGYDMPGYAHRVTARESLVLAQSEYDEHYTDYRIEAGVDHGALEYTTTFVKLPALYGFCERTASRGGESVDPEPWGALRAYSMGGDAYTLCYDGRIVEISLPFTPTDEQMAIVDEKLGV